QGEFLSEPEADRVVVNTAVLNPPVVCASFSLAGRSSGDDLAELQIGSSGQGRLAALRKHPAVITQAVAGTVNSHGNGRNKDFNRKLFSIRVIAINDRRRLIGVTGFSRVAVLHIRTGESC